MSEQWLSRMLEEEIQRAVDQGFLTFISGMAKGVDIVAAELVLRMRKRDPRLKLICALPHQGFGLHWGDGWTERFQCVLSSADLIRYVSQDFSYSSYQRRNEWMVDHSALVIAVFNGERGGTKNTIEYAAKQGVPCIILRRS
jgi:uncharacterized phage-like protein YoqJ